MNNQRIFIPDEHFDLLCGRVERFLKKDVNLPDNPFEISFKHYAFDEFDWALSGDFWRAISKLIVRYEDESVLVAVCDPSPREFKEAFGYYNWAKLPASLTVTDYWDFLNIAPEGNAADSILATCEEIMWISSSGQWAVWGERKAGICVLGSKDIPKDSDWKNIEWVIETFPNDDSGVFVRQLKNNFEY